MQHQTLQNLVGRADALINAGQFDALMDFYCDDATLVVKPGLNACGKAQIRQAFDAIARHFEHSLRVRQHDLRVIEAGDTALVMAEAVIESPSAWATGCCSSARTCSRCSLSRSAAPIPVSRA